MDSKQDVLNAALRSHLSFFIRKSFQTVSPGDPYLHNWHIDSIAYHLERVKQKQIKRLIITMPPRHLKSIAASVAFPAWLLGHDPQMRIICASYGSDLADKLSMDTRRILQAPWYQQCFPGTQISSEKNTQSEFATTAQGFRLATSVGGALTGLGADLLIVDDPQKADDAQSPDKLAKVREWYKQTVATRLNDPENGSIIVIQQRLHEEDLAGCLLEAGGWTHLNLPAIAESFESVPVGPGKVHERLVGTVLHSERMSKAALDQVRNEIGSLAFAAQYQQQPGPVGGEIIKWDWFKTYEVAPERTWEGDVIQSWDFACSLGRQSDYTVCLTWLYQDHCFYLLDVLRVKVLGPDLLRLVPKLQRQWQATTVIIEKTGINLPIFQQLYKLDPAIYVSSQPKDDKATRLGKYAFIVESGRVYLPEEAPWLPEFKKELQYFPNGKFDDQVDALSQFLLWAYKRTPPPPPGLFGIAA